MYLFFAERKSETKKRSKTVFIHFIILFFTSIFAVFSVRANVVGVDMQNFNPITDGLDYVTVHSSKTLEPGIINLGLFLNYAVNSLPNYENYANQSRTSMVDTLFSSDLNFGVGLTRQWDAGFSLPQVHRQTVDSDVFRGQYETLGVTEFRFNTKVRVLGDPQVGGVALVGSMNINRIDNNPFAGINPDPTFNFEFVWDRSFDNTSYSLNLGYRLRHPGEPIGGGVPVQPFGNQYLASVGVSHLVSEWDTKLIGEIFSSFPAESVAFTSDRELSSMELLLGVKFDITNSLAFHMGGGTELLHGAGSPDWRVYSGINWNIEPFGTITKREAVIAKVQKDKIKDQDEEVELSNEEEDPFAHVTPAAEETFVGRGVLFAFNSDQPAEDMQKILRPLIDHLKKPPGFRRLVIEGHTDSVGSAEYNLELSQRRANSVKRALTELGLPASKIKAVGYGEQKPVAPNTNYQGRMTNRRVEFKISR